MKRVLPFLLALVVILASASPVAAAEDSAWVELLEYSTVNDSGLNWFKYSSTATFSIPTPYSMRLTKIDMLITYPANTAPTAVDVYYNGTYYSLTMRRIDECTSRVYGTIAQNWYSDVRIRFTRSGTTTAYVEILSCKVSQLLHQEVTADAQVVIDNTYYSTGTAITVAGNDVSDTAYSQIRIDVNDWMEYDSLTIWGSALTMGLTSIRATVSTLALPFEVSYFQSVATGETTDSTYHFSYYDYSSTSGGYGNIYGDTTSAFEYNGKILFAITIDLTGVDRTLTTSPLYVYFTGVYSGLYGYTFNCQYVNGSIIVPDKSDITWWNKFTTFMSGLFGGDDPDAADFESQMESQGDAMQDAVDEMDAVTKPPVDDINVSVDSYIDPSGVSDAGSLIGELMSQELILFMLLISLTVALASFVIFGKR